MFDLLDRALAFIPVTWAGLGVAEDGSAVAVENTVDIQIEILDRDEFQAWMNDGGKDFDVDADPAERKAHEQATFRRVAKGWRRLKANGRPPEFNDANIALLLSHPGFVSAFGTAYMKAWRGQVEIREGNSVGSPDNGRAGEPTDAISTGATPSS